NLRSFASQRGAACLATQTQVFHLSWFPSHHSPRLRPWVAPDGMGLRAVACTNLHFHCSKLQDRLTIIQSSPQVVQKSPSRYSEKFPSFRKKNACRRGACAALACGSKGRI